MSVPQAEEALLAQDSLLGLLTVSHLHSARSFPTGGLHQPESPGRLMNSQIAGPILEFLI